MTVPYADFATLGELQKNAGRGAGLGMSKCGARTTPSSTDVEHHRYRRASPRP